ncbi:Extracellular matrix-binding protein ebhB [Streptococcus suis]|uniref:phage tail spike protein n=1 Tax=Streptococcus suis TaxID=1307 RepID=UPI0007696AA6|nr:phage tail spike protein [Streptococcus suis]NQM70476.1 matrix-binding protein EbhB [Streptococcus suis]CYX77262.1 Extracellular matrix-binding protein ebhB [Streptococcus suis]CYY53465.1 Extracellular matrix-binding protein ebhB [Streptococcus suis]CYZ29424.1 Extracellular matrix-binding protein ebhB [Streptococcus suis]CZB00784.1 Extracellular matrix-binding protein ebhB [Streptococcus suis]
MLYLLDKDVKTVKWNGIPLHEASSAIVKEETNGDFYITVRYPITDSGIYQLIKEDMLIKAPAPVLGAQLFRIKKPVENDDSLDITAYHISDDVMQRSINPLSVVGQGCAMALSQMVQNAKTDLGTFSFTSDIMDSRTFNTTDAETLYSVLLDGKHSIVGTWEGELVRDNFALTIKRSRGADRGVVITTHKNLKSYQRTKNSQSVVTRIHAKSTFKPDGAEDEVTLRVTVDSPLIGNYPYINEKDYENNNAKTVDELRKWAEAKFKNEGIDKVSDAIEIEAYELDGQVIHLGDTVNIKSRKHNVDIHKKAIAYEYNALTEEYISITFDDTPGVGGSGVSSGVSNAADVILEVNANAQEIAVERAIKNANQAFDAEFEKRVEEINDGIEQAKAEAERYADQIKTEISQEFDAFEQEYQVTKQSQSQQIADILAKAQANTILATDAKNIGNQAKADAANALSKAIQYKNEAIAEATRLDTVERQATETKLATAKSQAISEATRLVETAKSLLSGQISNISTDLSQTKEAIKLLATKATVDTLTGRVSSAEAMIQVQADQISQRVKTSDFDQAKQRISTAESSITQLGNRITTEISETVAKIPQHAGSRNYIKNSKLYDYVVTSVATQDVRFFIVEDFWKNSRRFERNMVRVSFDVTFNPALPRDISTNVHFSSSPWYQPGGITFKGNTTRKQHFDLLFDLSSASETYFTDNIFIRFNNTFPLATNVKIEQMTLYLSELTELWTPATEDLVNDISSVRTIINQTAEGQEQLSIRLTETQGKVTTAETNIRQLVNDVSSKVSQTTFDNLKRTVDSQGTSISQNQSAIALKAEKTYVDGVKTTADSALSKANSNADSIRTTKAELKVTSDAVATKVSQSDFNAVDQRLTSAETTIRTQAGLIEQRLTSTQVDAAIVGKGYQTASQVNTAITSKGYQTKADVDKNITDRGYITNSALQPYVTSTVFENKVRETTDSFSRSITETKALIPTDFSGGNLIRNGAFPTIPWSGSRVATHSFYYNSQKTLFLLETASTTNEATSGSSYFKVKRNTDYTLSFIAFSASRVKSSDVWFLGRKTGETQGFTSTNILISSRKFSPSFAEYITATFNSGENDEAYIRFDNNGSTDGQMAAMFFGEVMLVEGNTARKWEACFDDLVTETKYNEVKDTVDSHTRTIGEQGNSISQAIQTAQGLVTRVNNLKSGSRNYLLNSKLTTTDMTGISDTGSLDVPINISADCWKHDDVYKNQKIRLSLYYQSSVAYSTSRTFPVYFRKSPWYQIGTITYPANTVKLMKFEFTFGTMPTGFDATQIFIRFDRTLDRGRVHTIERAHLEVSDMFSDWSPAPEDGNQAIQAVSTQVNTLAGSWSVQNLNSSGDILSQANLSSTQFLLEAAKIRLKGKTLADEIQAIDGKFGTLFVADGTFAKLNATVIGSQAITADKLKVDQAFFDKLIANDAYLRQLFAKSVFTTQVQSVTLSASKISGGILTATNKAMEVNLNAGQIMYYTDQAALKRVLNGYPTQFVKFATGTVTGKGNAGVTVIGSNRWNSESSNDGGFVGIRAWNGANIDSLDLVGDDIRLASSAFDNPDGWDVRTLDSGLRIAPHNRAAERNSRIEVGDVWIMKGDGTYSSLRDILNSFNGNFSKGPNADSYTYYPKGF